MKHIIIAFLAIVGAWQLSTRPASADLERAYRANNVGVARLEQFDYEGAAASFRSALQIAPALHIARLNLGIALLYAGRPAEAAPEARAAAAQLSGSPTAHYVAGLIAKADNNLDEAATAFERVLQLDPRDAGARVQLGQVQLQRRRYDDALKLFQEALAAEPYNVTAAYSVAIALARAGRADEGRPAMQRFEALRDSAYGVTYSQAYLGQGHYGEAIASTGAEPELVDPATPDVTFSEPMDIIQPSAAAKADSNSAGGVTLFDADGDGDLDLLATGGDGARLFRNDRGRFTDDTPRALPGSLRSAPARGAVAGDYDNDGRPDLFLLRDAGARLLHQKMDATFEDATGALPATTGARSAAFVDVDHDGDLDIVAAGRAVQLARNNGNGTFADITAAAGLSAAGGAAVIAPGDFDNRRDVDLLLAGGGTAPSLYRNMRDGSFRDAAADTRLPRTIGATSLAVGDVNKDGYIDLFFGAASAPGTLAMSDGRGAFRTRAAPEGTAAAVTAQFVDYDHDGLLDLLVMLPHGLRLFRNTGADRWVDTTVPSQLSAIAPITGAQFDALAVGDVDRDGDADLVFRDTGGSVRAWKNSGSRHASLRIALAAHVSNRTGAGAKVELRAGSLRQMVETSATTPAVAPADVLFGLGTRSSADVVRVLWPSGILQAEIPTADAAAKPALAMTITELDRKPSSCPYLFTWNGTRFEFVTDFMGGGEMGGWIAPSVWNQPDPDEYVRIRGDQLQARDGRYELRITNELEEALFVDRVQLVAVDHQAGTEVYPNEGLRQPPRAAFRLTATRNARPPVRASDEHGHDVLPQITAMDRRYPDDFTRLPIRGYAAPHELILDLGGATADDAVLLLSGWTDYAFSSDNVAASHSGIEMAAPMLQVQDSAGRWTTAIADLGFPVGRPQTIAVNLAGKFLSASRQVRIVTSMRIYWDRIQVASVVQARPKVTRIDAAGAYLRARGFSGEIAPDDREPFGYEYERVSTTSPWKTLAGRYTREGDVRTLVHTVDDMFVVSRPGDEIALSFDAQALPALPGGWTRTFLLYAHGYSKEMNPRSASPDTVAPLPFRAMSKYPYGPDEHYPDTPAHRDYLAHYNTRIVHRSVPSIDTLVGRER